MQELAAPQRAPSFVGKSKCLGFYVRLSSYWGRFWPRSTCPDSDHRATKNTVGDE